MKKFLGSLFCLLVFTTSVFSFAEEPIREEGMYLKIQHMIEKDMMHGKVSSKEKFLTRAEAAKILVLASGAGSNGKTSVFRDVSQSHWANEYIKAAYDKGYIKGYGDKTFRPNEKVRYVEWVAMLSRVHTNWNRLNKQPSWPNGCLRFAFENKIINHIPSDKKELTRFITLKEAFELVYNIADERPMEDIKKEVTEKDQIKDENVPLAYPGGSGGSSSSGSSSSDESSQEKIVEFKDEDLKKFILTRLHRYEGVDEIEEGMAGEYNFKLIDPSYRKDKNSQDIFVKDMEQIECLGIRGYHDAEYEVPLEVRDLTGLEYAKNLRMLTISSHDVDQSYAPNAFKDVSPLKDLKKLEFLRLSHNAIEDVEPLSHISSLRKLYLSHNQIQDISSLTKLVDLKELDLARNKIENMEGIRALSQLEMLVVLGNHITDLSEVEELYKLTYLSAGENSIEDLSPVQKLSELENLYFDHANIKDFRVLEGLKKIAYLTFNHQKIDFEKEIRVSKKDLEMESPFLGLQYIIDGKVSVKSDNEAIAVSYDTEKNMLELHLDENWAKEHNNQKISIDLEFTGNNKYLFFGMQEEVTLKVENVVLDLEIE